ncbi:hypothetical protein [Actinoplanes sp. URMC 104]|uniref:hypothetical protein n=1 Tax=Actinoplanes sp. URMC 104 TaxID=3423409 RepID=UPI003F1B5211
MGKANKKGWRRRTRTAIGNGTMAVGPGCRMPAQGEVAHGEEAQGEEARGKEAQGEEAQGEEAQGEEAQGEEARGKEAQGEEWTEPSKTGTSHRELGDGCGT